MRIQATLVICLTSLSTLIQTYTNAQPGPFVPLDFEYPESVLTVPQTYVYKNSVTGAIRYKDIAFEKKGTDVIINWKEYDGSALIDSCTLINHKSVDHYMILNGRAIKANVAEDSVHEDGSRLGEKIQTIHFTLDPTISLYASTRSFFLKDTTISWQEKLVPCIVIQSFYRQQLTNTLFPDKPKEVNGIAYYYFGKNIGLVMYRTELENEKSTWRLVEIKDRKK